MTNDERYDLQIERRIERLEDQAKDFRKEIDSLKNWRIAVVALAVPTAFGTGTFSHGLWTLLVGHP